MFRHCVCWHCHRTGAAGSWSRSLLSGCLQKKMLFNVSSDLSNDTLFLLLMILLKTVFLLVMLHVFYVPAPQKSQHNNLRGDG